MKKSAWLMITISSVGFMHAGNQQVSPFNALPKVVRYTTYALGSAVGSLGLAALAKKLVKDNIASDNGLARYAIYGAASVLGLATLAGLGKSVVLQELINEDNKSNHFNLYQQLFNARQDYWFADARMNNAARLMSQRDVQSMIEGKILHPLMKNRNLTSDRLTEQRQMLGDFARRRPQFNEELSVTQYIQNQIQITRSEMNRAELTYLSHRNNILNLLDPHDNPDLRRVHYSCSFNRDSRRCEYEYLYFNYFSGIDYVPHLILLLQDADCWRREDLLINFFKTVGDNVISANAGERFKMLIKLIDVSKHVYPTHAKDRFCDDYARVNTSMIDQLGKILSHLPEQYAEECSRLLLSIVHKFGNLPGLIDLCNKYRFDKWQEIDCFISPDLLSLFEAKLDWIAQINDRDGFLSEVMRIGHNMETKHKEFASYFEQCLARCKFFGISLNDRMPHNSSITFAEMYFKNYGTYAKNDAGNIDKVCELFDEQEFNVLVESLEHDPAFKRGIDLAYRNGVGHFYGGRNNRHKRMVSIFFNAYERLADFARSKENFKMHAFLHARTIDEKYRVLGKYIKENNDIELLQKICISIGNHNDVFDTAVVTQYLVECCNLGVNLFSEEFSSFLDLFQYSCQNGSRLTIDWQLAELSDEGFERFCDVLKYRQFTLSKNQFDNYNHEINFNNKIHVRLRRVLAICLGNASNDSVGHGLTLQGKCIDMIKSNTELIMQAAQHFPENAQYMRALLGIPMQPQAANNITTTSSSSGSTITGSSGS